MQTLIDTTFSGKDISTAVSVYEYAATSSGMHSFQVRMAAVAGNGDYIGHLTLNDGDAQSDDVIGPRTTYAAASGETAFWFSTLKIPLISGDVVNFFILGQAGDTSEAGSVRIFLENYSVLVQSDILSDATPFAGANIDAAISDVILTNAATTAGSGLSGANLTLTNGVTFAETITGLTIPATWATAYLTVKANPLIVGDDDATNSIIQFKVTNNAGAGDAGDGIQYVNKAAATATEKAYGSITVDQGAGTLAVAVADDMAFSYIGNWTYDIKFIVDAGTSTKPVQSANWSIQLTETKTV